MSASVGERRLLSSGVSARSAAANTGTGAPTQEYLIRHTLESFLDRLTRTAHAEDFVLKGGILLAAYGVRQRRWFEQRPLVEAMERCGNRRPRVERLVSAWNQGIRGDANPDGEADDPLIGASAEPKKRPRTRLTNEEVDAMRTARAQGVGVNALARRFGVHRGTVWAKTR